MSLNVKSMNIVWLIPDLVHDIKVKVPSELDSLFRICHQQGTLIYV